MTKRSLPNLIKITPSILDLKIRTGGRTFMIAHLCVFLSFALDRKLQHLNPSGHYMYRQVKRTAILRSAHTVYLRVLCGSQNKQRLFPYTALTDWFL